MAFVDYEKAFDSIETPAVLKPMKEQGIPGKYTRNLRNVYETATASIRLHENCGPIYIRRGVRQGNTISPKLFTAALESIFKHLDWVGKGINIDSKYLHHLRFADDIVIFARTAEDLQTMLEELNVQGKQVGMKMNMEKTKVILNSECIRRDIEVDNIKLEAVSEYIYLGQKITADRDMDREIDRRIGLGWAAYGKHRHLLESNIPLCLKRKIVDQIILPCVTYASETWSTTQRQNQKLRVMQRKMERRMVGVTLRDRRRNDWLREQTKVKDIVVALKENKWRWAGHIGRMENQKWAKMTTDWHPWYGKRKKGRPCTRWRDEVDREYG